MSSHDLHLGPVLDAEYEGTRSDCGKVEVQDEQDLEHGHAVSLWPGPLHTTLLLLDPSSTTRFVGTTITRCGHVLSLIAAAVVRRPYTNHLTPKMTVLNDTEVAAASQPAASGPHGHRSRGTKQGPGHICAAMDGREGSRAEEKAKAKANTGERIINLPTTTQDCRGRREA